MKSPIQLVAEFVIRRDLAMAQRAIRAARQALVAGNRQMYDLEIDQAKHHLAMATKIREAENDSET